MKANETNFIALIRQKREEGKKLFPRPLLCIMAGEQQSFLFQRINIFHIIYNHQRDLKRQRVIKFPDVKSCGLMQLLNPVDQRIAVYIELPRSL